MTSVGLIRAVKATSFLAVFAFISAVPAWCSVSACPGNPTTVTVASLIGSGGCFTSDATFSNFTIGTAAGEPAIDNFPSAVGTIPVNTPGLECTVGNTCSPSGAAGLCASGFTCPPDGNTVFATDSATNPGTITIGSPGPDTGGNGPTTNDCTTSNGGSGGWCLSNTGKQALFETSQISFTLTTVDPTNTVGIDVLAISHSSSGGGSGGEALVYEEICPGSVTVTSFSQSCPGYQVVQAGSVNGNFNKTAVAVSAVFSNPDTVYYIRDTVILQTTQSNGDFSTLESFDTTFTPEPGTLGLFGAAFAGLGLLHRRLRRKA